METFWFLVTYITNLDGFYIIKNNRRTGKERKVMTENEISEDFEKRYIMCCYMSWQKYGRIFFAVDERNDEVYELKNIAYEIITLLIYESYTLKQIVQILSKKYDIQEITIKNDVMEFIDQLNQVGIIREDK